MKLPPKVTLGDSINVSELDVTPWPFDVSGNTGALTVRRLKTLLELEDPDDAVTLVFNNLNSPLCGLAKTNNGVLLIEFNTAQRIAEANRKKP